MERSKAERLPLPGIEELFAEPIDEDSDITGGYTGRKLENYIWVPKPKTDLYEFRELLKRCLELEKLNGSFSDISLGEHMVRSGAIFDGRLAPDQYMEKYQEKTTSNQSYVSNARMALRICRWLGWVSRVPHKAAAYVLTEHGLLLTQYQGAWPARRGVSEADLTLAAFAEMKYYSVNDALRNQNKKFRQRIFLNMLRILDKYEYCSHYELALTAFCIGDERDEEEWEVCDSIIDGLRNGELNFAAAFERRGLNAENRSTVTGIYDGPKVLLSFARQLGLVEDSDPESLGVDKQYAAMCRESGFIKRIGKVFRLTNYGRSVVEKETIRQCIWYDELWYDELGNNTNFTKQKARACVLLALQSSSEHKLSRDKVEAILPLDENEIRELAALGAQIQEEGVSIRLVSQIVFDSYRDVPPEVRSEIISAAQGLLPTPLPSLMNEDDEQFFVKLDLARAVAEPTLIPLVSRDEVLPYSPIKMGFGSVLFPTACIHCAEPPCMIYEGHAGASRAQDYHSELVCPDNLINFTADGHITIDVERCTGCMICVARCPIGAITYRGGIAHKLEYKENADQRLVKPVFIPLENKKDLTNIQLGQLTHNHNQLTNPNIKDVLDNFEKRITQPGDTWAQEQFYTWVRNIYRALGFDARYTGAPGMKTRSDITVYSPLKITNEVKSPAESSINGKAVRQAFDSLIQLKGQGFEYTAAIGVTISNDANERAKSFEEYEPIPLITARVLLYLMIKHNQLPQTSDDIAVIFSQGGTFGRKQLINYFNTYFDIRYKALNDFALGNSGSNTLLLVGSAATILRNVKGERVAVDQSLVSNVGEVQNKLAVIEAEVIAEIGICFT